MHLALRAAKDVAFTIAAISSAPLGYLACLLLFTAESTRGHLFGLAVILGFLMFLTFWGSTLASATKIRTRRRALILGAIVLALLVLNLTLRPPAPPAETPGVPYSVYLPNHPAHPLSLSAFVPEVDQLKLGTGIIPFFDPLISNSKGDRVATLFSGVSQDMRTDSNFVALRTVLDSVYTDMAGGDFDLGHMYIYLPETESTEPLPVFIFLHGAMGNFKSYLWVWKELADSRKMAIVAPSWGVGNWSRTESTFVIERTLDYCDAHPRLDSSRVTLAGLSNGGMGVSHAAHAFPDRIESLVYLSPVIKSGDITPTLLAAWANRPVLLIHGTEDLRIPLLYVTQPVAQMRAANIRVTERYVDDEDHFLFFSQPNLVREEIKKWLP